VKFCQIFCSFLPVLLQLGTRGNHRPIQCVLVSWISVQWQLCFTRRVNEYPYFPRLLFDLGEIRYKMCEDNAVENFWCFLETCKGKSYCYCHHKWNYIYACTVKQDVIRSKERRVKFRMLRHKYSICSFYFFDWRKGMLKNKDSVDFGITHFACAGNIIYLSKKHQLSQACRDVSKRSFLAEVLSCISSIFPSLLP